LNHHGTGEVTAMQKFAFRTQAVPLGYEGVSLQVDGVEVVRYQTGMNAWRPFLFPVFGPSGRMVTRIGHPHDPHGHRHHYSIWMGHANVNGLNFWSDDTNNKQVHRRFIELGDGIDRAWCAVEIDWVANGAKPLLRERRTIAMTYPRKPDDHKGFWLLDIVSEFEALEETVTFGVTPFGLLGVRVAKSMGVRDGGGRVMNSNGQINERETMAQRAAWCDYSGWVAEGVWEGICIFDHPQNFDHPPAWHVRDDGWFCPSHFRHMSLHIAKGHYAKFRYRIVIHSTGFEREELNELYRQFEGEFKG